MPLLGTTRTLTGAQTWIVEKGCTPTTAIGRAAEGAAAGTALVSANVICAAAGATARTATHAVRARRRQAAVLILH